jgi:hypothetical protein
MECLYNTHSNNIAGYCHNPEHPYAMTPRQIICKNCLGKQCGQLERNEEHQWWHQREVKKQKRKKRKENLNNYVNSIKGKA